MSSTEPPSRNLPRNQPQDTKSARDELSSKGKVEKVREIDADEQARKRKFLKFYKDDAQEDENFQAENRPSPFDLYSGKDQKMDATEGGGKLGSSSSSFSDAEDAIVPAPAYSPPPDVNPSGGGYDEEGEDAATEGALPQSDSFWEEFPLPDEPTPPANFQETTGMPGKASLPGKAPQARNGVPPARPGSMPEKAASSKEGKEKGKQAGKGAKLSSDAEKKKHQEPSPFGPPGKPAAKGPSEAHKPAHQKTDQPAAIPVPRSPFEPEVKTHPSKQPSSKPSQPSQLAGPSQPPEHPSRTPKVRPMEKEERAYAGPLSGTPKAEKKEVKERTEEEGYLTEGPGAMPLQPEEREGGGGGSKRGREQKAVEIESPSLPALPTHVQPMAMAAATQATPYINSAAISLFYQMVGTMYVMSGPQGVSRTEIVLNNPSFANSKFYGSTITIEKYETAPDSFNIRLTGSDEAVASFRENIPSLMTAFQNGNFTFRVNRLDVEYSLERPLFRRKEKGEGKDEAGGGDLGERRK